MTALTIKLATTAADHHIARMAALALGLSMLEAVIPSPLPGWFGPVTHSIFGAFAHIAGKLLLVYFWLIPHAGLVYLIPVFAMAALLFGTVNGLIATHYLDAPNTELEAPKLTG